MLPIVTTVFVCRATHDHLTSRAVLLRLFDVWSGWPMCGRSSLHVFQG